MSSIILAPLLATIQELEIDLDTIESARKVALLTLVSKIKKTMDESRPVQLNFICTHNSRRSHLAQIWAHIAADYYGLDHMQMYSGGTESTAMFSVIKSTLISQGFLINEISGGDNPVYAIRYANNRYPIIAFSKRYDHAYNPTKEFIAVMTCDHADTHCPVVIGSDYKIALTYDDPKAFDESPLQTQKYLEKSNQIASEMMIIFKTLSEQI